MLILAMENPVLHQMHGKQYLPYLFTSRFRIFSKSSFLKSHKYMNSFMGAHLTSCTAETKPIYASKKNFCLIKPLKYMWVYVCWRGVLGILFLINNPQAADIMNNGVTIYHGLCLPFPRFRQGNNDYVLTEAEKRKYPDSKCGVIWPFCIFF